MIKMRIFYILFIFFLLEVTSRVALMYTMKVPFYKPSDIIYTFYKKLQAVEQPKFRDKDGYYDILFLGASTLNNKWGNIEELLLRGLEGRLNRKIRIFNLAVPAFTSRDSLTMYTRLKDRKFDLVLLYNNINDLRTNNLPPEIFKEDYSMYPFYNDINIILAHKEIDFLTLPYSLHIIGSRILEMFTHSLVLTYDPQIKWMKYGSAIKTKIPFKKNLRGILDIASKKEETVVLMTFASYIPNDYSLSKFKGKLLDYGRHRCPVEDWGYPQSVAKGIKVHNEIIREAAMHYNNLVFVDQDKLIPKSGLYFDDICHLTEKGCEKFVDNILEALIITAGG